MKGQAKKLIKYLDSKLQDKEEFAYYSILFVATFFTTIGINLAYNYIQVL